MRGLGALCSTPFSLLLSSDHRFPDFITVCCTFITLLHAYLKGIYAATRTQLADGCAFVSLLQCGKQEEGRLESPLDAPWLQWCADFQDAARELAEREMTEGKVAFDPTDEVRPER